MSPRLRRLALTVHVASSVGWLGSVAVVLALALAGATSNDPELVRAVDIAMEFAGWTVLVPLSLASLASGLVQALGTSWGLFRHYWVIIKLAMNVLASVVLLLYMQTLGALADAADDPESRLDVLSSPSPVVHAAAALLLLVVATVLAIYKPRGRTRYGQRKARRA